MPGGKENISFVVNRLNLKPKNGSRIISATDKGQPLYIPTSVPSMPPIPPQGIGEKRKKATKPPIQTPGGIKKDGMIHRTPGGQGRDYTDDDRARHGRDTHVGHRFGAYLQSPPLIFTRDKHTMPMGDMFRGASAFLICGGPSFAQVDKTKLSQPGVLTMGINNSMKTFRSNLWISVDDPTHFIKSVWIDPTIMKFVPLDHAEKYIFDNEKWVMMGMKVGDCPNVWYYKRNEKFNAKQFLWEDTFNWGNHKDYGGGRSVMLVAIRMMFFLGIRNIFLLGADFKMDESKGYHFDQSRSKESVANNNDTFSKMINRFTELKPIFEKNGLFLYNCNPESELKVFPFISVDDAIANCLYIMPKDLANERTEGLYDRMAHIKDATNKEVEVSKALDKLVKQFSAKFEQKKTLTDTSEIDQELKVLSDNIKVKELELEQRRTEKEKVITTGKV